MARLETSNILLTKGVLKGVVALNSCLLASLLKALVCWNAVEFTAPSHPTLVCMGRTVRPLNTCLRFAGFALAQHWTARISGWNEYKRALKSNFGIVHRSVYTSFKSAAFAVASDQSDYKLPLSGKNKSPAHGSQEWNQNLDFFFFNSLLIFPLLQVRLDDH